MNSNIAFANTIRVFHFFRFNSSLCIVDQNDSIMALSYISPMDPNEGIRQAERILFVKAREVNWTLSPAWTTPPGRGLRCFIAMSRALTISCES